jgi:DNA-directed RNA polymerase II subunit RPB1
MEMNMHVPQSLQTHEELKQITLVQTQIISPGTSSPSMGIIQDTLIGGYLLTANDNKIKKYEMNNLMMFAKNFDGIYPTPAGLDENGQEYWNGKQLYSLILPDLNIKEKNITIVRGEIVDGFLDKNMLGRDASGLIKQIYNSYGAVHTKNFFNDTEKLVTRWMTGNSFSIGFGDCILTETQREEVKNVIRTNINPAYELIKKAHNGIYMTDLDDKYKLAQLETDMTTILSKVDEKVKEYINKHINKDNNLYIMSSKVGSAGSELHIRQIMASVGPQFIWGERVANGFTERTLPHYPRNDLSPEAKGFVRHSFIEGTDPSETFFVAMSGRTGTISTAIKTAESGYISRKLIKASEELKVNYDFTIRNSSNNIIQFCYGDDNMDPSKLEKISKIELIEFNNKKMLDVYQFDNFNRNYFEMFMGKDAVDKMMADENYKTILEDEFKLMMDYRDVLRNKYFFNTEVIGDINTFIPFNLYRIIPSIRIKFNIEDFHISDITPQYVIDRFNTMISDIMKYLPEKNNNWKLFIIIFKTLLSPKRILMEYRFTKSAYDYLLDLMKQKMIEALINPGELVGIIAAQTLGQNTTQLTLNSFHTAGSATGSAVITEGLPRLLEIINITKNLKNSNMWIYLKDEFSKTKEEAQKIRAKFTYTKLKNLLTKSEILFDNKNGITDTNEDREFIRSYKDFTEYFGIDVNEENSFSPWILRLIFDKETMMNRKITVQEVQEIIKENSHNDQDIECIFSDDSSSNIVMRIRIKHDGKGNFLDFMKDFEKQLIELTIRGIDKIESLELKEKNIIKYSLDGSLVNTKEWVLNTNGSNLIDIMSNEAVDTRRTTTNNILEFFEIFGIEATRSLLYVEIKKIFIESNPNPRHIQMFADLMTYRGKLMTIDRHGVNKNPEIGPIGKASFEEVMNIFTKSALFAEKDNMKGVSSNILAGQFCPAGTNNFELMIDEEKIVQSINNEYEEEIIVDTDVDRIFQQTYGIKEDFEDVNEEDFEFGFGLENNKKHLLNEALETDVTIFDTKSKDVEKIVIDEKNLEEIPIEPVNYSQNVDFDAIEVEDPTYKEQNKEKKIKIVRKKK